METDALNGMNYYCSLTEKFFRLAKKVTSLKVSKLLLRLGYIMVELDYDLKILCLHSIFR